MTPAEHLREISEQILTLRPAAHSTYRLVVLQKHLRLIPLNDETKKQPYVYTLHCFDINKGLRPADWNSIEGKVRDLLDREVLV